MNSTPTVPIANQTQGDPPRTRTSFLSIANPMDRDLTIIIFMGTNKKEAKNACASETLAQNPFTIRKDRPENSLVLRMLHLLCWSRVTCHQSPYCKHHRSDSSGLESFLIVNVPAKEVREGGKI
jgi:hypothetical protein